MTATTKKDRKRQVIKLRIAGLNEEKIAKELGVSQKTVSNDVQEWREEQKKKYDLDYVQDQRVLDMERLECIIEANWDSMLAGDRGATSLLVKAIDRRAAYLGYDALIDRSNQAPDEAKNARIRIRSIGKRAMEIETSY